MKRSFIVTLSMMAALIVYAQSKPSAASMEHGKKVYEMYCQSCHKPDGAGDINNPPVTKNDWVSGDKKKLIGVVIKGMKEPVEIDGKSFKNPMPQHDYLKDEEIADVLTYVRNSFGNKYSAVTKNEVKRARPAFQPAESN